MEIHKKEGVPASIRNMENVVKTPSGFSLAIDARELFNDYVFTRPQKLAIFTDNLGEIKFNLLYVLAQAKEYEGLAGANPSLDNWQIGIISKSIGIDSDVTMNEVRDLIFNDPDLYEIIKYLDKGKIRLINGPKLQGADLRRPAREMENFLKSVEQDNGTVIAFGMAR